MPLIKNDFLGGNMEFIFGNRGGKSVYLDVKMHEFTSFSSNYYFYFTLF